MVRHDVRCNYFSYRPNIEWFSNRNYGLYNVMLLGQDDEHQSSTRGTLDHSSWVSKSISGKLVSLEDGCNSTNVAFMYFKYIDWLVLQEGQTIWRVRY